MASVLPLYLQNRAGLSAAQTGIAMLPFSLAMLTFPFAGAWLGRRKPHHFVLPVGFLLVATGNCLAAWGAFNEDWSLLALGMFVLGSGAGILNGEGQRAIMATIPRSHSGIASGISTTARFSGILLGFAALNAVASAARLIVAAQSAVTPTADQARAPELSDFSAILMAAGCFALLTALIVSALLRRQSAPKAHPKEKA